MGIKQKKLSLYSKAKIITYNSPKSDYFIEKNDIHHDLTNILIHTPKGPLPIQTTLIGQFNFENILAAVSLADHLGINFRIIQKAVFSYRGVKRRLELIDNLHNILFFEDFAQSANRIKSTIDALKTHFPDKLIKVFFQPHASFTQYKTNLIGLRKAFYKADEVVLGPIRFNPKIDKKSRTTAKDFKKEIGSKLIYIPIEKEITTYYIHQLSSNDILVHMSSGGLSGNKIIKSIIKHFH